MSRHYIVPSWVGAAEDHDNWSGTSPDDRKRPSVSLNGHFKPNGAANIGRYSDDKVEAKAKGLSPELELEYKLFPQQQTLNKIDVWEKEVERHYRETGDEEACQSALNSIQLKRQRAWKSLCKAKGWALDEEPEEVRQDVQDTYPIKKGLTPEGEKAIIRVCWWAVVIFVVWANW